MCGAPNCRGFIGKRTAQTSSKSDPARKKMALSQTVKRVVRGRVIKLSRKMAKAEVQNGKVVATKTIAPSRRQKTIGKTKARPTIRKPKIAAVSKKATARIQKRRREISEINVGNTKIGKRKRNNENRAGSMVKSSKSSSNQQIYDTVRRRPRQRIVR